MSHGNVNNSGITWFVRLDRTGVVDLEEALLLLELQLLFYT